MFGFYRKKSFALWLFLILMLPVFVSAQEETITVTTYHPSPLGIFHSFNLYPNDTVGTQPCNDNTEGTLYYDRSDSNLYLCRCDTSGTCNWQNLTSTEVCYDCSHPNIGQYIDLERGILWPDDMVVVRLPPSDPSVFPNDWIYPGNRHRVRIYWRGRLEIESGFLLATKADVSFNMQGLAIPLTGIPYLTSSAKNVDLNLNGGR